jgi:hypothetical protein
MVVHTTLINFSIIHYNYRFTGPDLYIPDLEVQEDRTRAGNSARELDGRMEVIR